MNQATKLLLLSAILVLLAAVIGKLQGPNSPGDQTASLRDRRKSASEPTIPSRLSGQPQILRAKQESGLEPSPKPSAPGGQPRTARLLSRFRSRFSHRTADGPTGLVERGCVASSEGRGWR